ncbi:MAG: hypothetical protein AAF799_16450 [Myxococcota bacterium]
MKSVLPSPFVVALALVSLAGCGSQSPKTVCDKLYALAADEFIEEGEGPDEMLCLETVTELKEDVSKEEYEKFAACVLETDDYEVARFGCWPESYTEDD